mgnify:FL=1
MLFRSLTNYDWEQIEGNLVLLSSPSGAVTTFRATQPGILKFALRVRDSSGSWSLASSILITVVEKEKPQIQENFDRLDPTTILDPDTQGGGCFIISASFGANSLAVQFFQLLRDKLLLKIPGGEILMEAYYRYSPICASYVEKSQYLKFLVQTILILLIFILITLPLAISMIVIQQCLTIDLKS